MTPKSAPSIGLAPLLSKPAVARYLGVCTASVGRYTKAGLLPFVRVGNFYRFHPEDVQEFLNRSKRSAGRLRT